MRLLYYFLIFNEIFHKSYCYYISSLCNTKMELSEKRLMKLRNNIDRYMKKDIPIEKGIQSNCGPIKKIEFDKIFINLFSIKQIYITPNEDRIVVVLTNNHKYVYYAYSDEDKEKIRQIIRVAPNCIKIIIVTDIRVFENIGSFLYCENKDNK